MEIQIHKKAIEIIRPGKFAVAERNQYDVLRGVTKAISNNETRFVLNFMKIEKERIVATDGRRIHMCDNDIGLPEGLWKPVVNKVKTMVLIPDEEKDRKYPNYAQAIPIEHGYTQVADSTELSVTLGKLGKTDTYAHIDYVKEAIDSKTSCPDGFTVHVNDNLSPIVIKGKVCGFKCVLMPLRST